MVPKGRNWRNFDFLLLASPHPLCYSDYLYGNLPQSIRRAPVPWEWTSSAKLPQSSFNFCFMRPGTLCVYCLEVQACTNRTMWLLYEYMYIGKSWVQVHDFPRLLSLPCCGCFAYNLRWTPSVHSNHLLRSSFAIQLLRSDVCFILLIYTGCWYRKYVLFRHVFTTESWATLTICKPHEVTPIIHTSEVFQIWKEHSATILDTFRCSSHTSERPAYGEECPSGPVTQVASASNVCTRAATRVFCSVLLTYRISIPTLSASGLLHTLTSRGCTIKPTPLRLGKY